ncbi:MAG TPA: hypothetical protein VKE93_21150 [Candidatus Angelobacter sp.]|nr:hypothetical protein [Candidatus Angelobacter sp.]
MWAVNLRWYERVLWLLVIYGILYVLISPLPELDATLSGKSVLVFVLVTYALLGLLILSFPDIRPSSLYPVAQTDVLDKTCVRLC